MGFCFVFYVCFLWCLLSMGFCLDLELFDCDIWVDSLVL
uniref:Uncharacterized protein n=1 Tax=Rhizophora mucronata TaxID=61149 RepID=A0A2P2R0Y8_RHIMU